MPSESKVEKFPETKADTPHSAVTKAAAAGAAQDVGGVAGERLKSFVERIERMNEEAAAVREDTKEIYAELKGVGFDAKTVRRLIAARKMEPEKRREQQDLFELYKNAIGMC